MLQFENDSHFQGAFMEKKRYNTAGKLKLAAYLKGTADLPPQSAEEIYAGLCAAEGTAPGRSSVYRMLGTLCEEGTVQRFPAGTGENSFVYQHVGNHRSCHTHLHLHCTVCGTVTHLECKCSREITEHLMASHGFAVDAGRSVLYGTCTACAAKGGQ
jgi:Fur family ferric uptake transcriptional regulator